MCVFCKTINLVPALAGKGDFILVTIGDALMLAKEELPAELWIRVTDNGNVENRSITIDELRKFPKERLELKVCLVPRRWYEERSAAVKVMMRDHFAEEITLFASISPQRRAEEAATVRKHLDALKKQSLEPQEKILAITDAIKKIFLINKVSLRTKRPEITISERTVMSETQGVVNAAVEMMDDVNLISSLFRCFKTLSNGETLNHVVRVFSMQVSFMQYWNEQHTNRIGHDIKRIFNEHYASLYKMLLPNIPEQNITFDNVIQFGNISAENMKLFALGALLHDIGKMADIDYFESDQAFNAEKIRQHVFISAGLILMNYGDDMEEGMRRKYGDGFEDAKLMAGDHHNALGHKDGYGVTRLERERSPRALKTLERCITAKRDEYMQGKALGYLPIELLAVIDVFDALTDPTRAYKQHMDPEAALRLMYEKMVRAGKLDPIIFDLFVDFVARGGAVVPLGYGVKAKAT